MDTAPQEHEVWSKGHHHGDPSPPRAGWSRGHGSPTHLPGKGPPTLVMTLEDMQKAALTLEKSAEFESGGEGLESREEEEELHGGSDDPDHTQVHPSHTQHFVCHTPTSERDILSLGGGPVVEAEYSWRDDHTPQFPRNGRDSPATDMAVANLDLYSESMLQPLTSPPGDVMVGSSQCARCEEASLVRHLHHYHHIICHHSQP